MERGDRKKVRELQQENLKGQKIAQWGWCHLGDYSVQLREASIPLFVDSGATALQVQVEMDK